MTDRDVRQQARALGDPTRYRIYEYVRDASEPVTVSALTDHIGLHHNAVRQHLGKLVAAGILVEQSEVRTTRGRPRNLYRVDPELDARWRTFDPYRRLSTLLVEVLSEGRQPEDVGYRAGRMEPLDGHDAGGADHRGHTGEDEIETLRAVLAKSGFDPRLVTTDSGPEFALDRCPFAEAAAVNPGVVCRVHLGIAKGVASQLPSIEVESLLPADPFRAGCRLLFRYDPTSSTRPTATGAEG